MGPEDILRLARMAKFINPASSTPQELRTLNNLWKVHKDLANKELQLSPGLDLTKAAQAQEMTSKAVGNAYLAGKVLHDPEPRYLQLQTQPDAISANAFIHPPGYFAQDPNALYIEDLASLVKGGGSGILEHW